MHFLCYWDEVENSPARAADVLRLAFEVVERRMEGKRLVKSEVRHIRSHWDALNVRKVKAP